MSKLFFDIKFGTLGQLSSERVILCVLPLDFPHFFHLFLLFSLKFRNNQIRFLL